MDPRRLLPVLAATACAFVVATVLAVLRPTVPVSSVEPARSTEQASVPSSADRSTPRQVLAGWDARRAAAWAAGDAAALEALYVEHSDTGAADVRLLRAWRRRGLRVEGLTTQVLRLEVARRSSRRLVLVVTDRVVGGQAVGAAGTQVLPVGRPGRRRVVLVRSDDDWLVEAVEQERPRGQRSPAASTSVTSSSSKS